jgi:hypothetical protein
VAGWVCVGDGGVAVAAGGDPLAGADGDGADGDEADGAGLGSGVA